MLGKVDLVCKTIIHCGFFLQHVLNLKLVKKKKKEFKQEEESLFDKKGKAGVWDLESLRSGSSYFIVFLCKEKKRSDPEEVCKECSGAQMMGQFTNITEMAAVNTFYKKRKELG